MSGTGRATASAIRHTSSSPTTLLGPSNSPVLGVVVVAGANVDDVRPDVARRVFVDMVEMVARSPITVGMLTSVAYPLSHRALNVGRNPHALFRPIRRQSFSRCNAK